MTAMKTPLPLPDPNDAHSIVRHRQAVCKTYSALFDLIDQAFAESVPQATNLFELMGGPLDLAVHASNTRYLAKLTLGDGDLPVEDEEVPDYEMPRIANCGLCLRLDGCEVRILKATVGGIPKAASDARSRFYSSNQLLLQFEGRGSSMPESTLSLIVLWDMDTDYSYSGIEIACPRGERRDGSVDCYWKVRWQRKSDASKTPKAGPSGPGGDLDEIKIVSPPKTATS
jgi:hypothetical protein